MSFKKLQTGYITVVSIISLFSLLSGRGEALTTATVTTPKHVSGTFTGLCTASGCAGGTGTQYVGGASPPTTYVYDTGTGLGPKIYNVLSYQVNASLTVTVSHDFLANSFVVLNMDVFAGSCTGSYAYAPNINLASYKNLQSTIATYPPFIFSPSTSPADKTFCYTIYNLTKPDSTDTANFDGSISASFTLVLDTTPPPPPPPPPSPPSVKTVPIPLWSLIFLGGGLAWIMRFMHKRKLV